MTKNISRRSFLRGTLAAAAADGRFPCSLPTAVRGAEPTELATLIDIRKCIGCEACVEACRDANDARIPGAPKRLTRRSRVKAEDFGKTGRPGPAHALLALHPDGGGDAETLTIPRRCMHCQNPPCADLCPWGASRKLVIDPGSASAGRNARSSARGTYIDLLPAYAGNGVMFKYRCHQRMADGELPACIEACPESVQKIGPRADIVKEAHALPGRSTGTSTERRRTAAPTHLCIPRPL